MGDRVWSAGMNPALLLQLFLLLQHLEQTHHRAEGCRVRDKGYVDGGPGKDGIPSINNPDFNPVEIADLSDSSMVLGVYLNGTARAYPTYILRWHEIVNDQIGNEKIAITYSVLAGASSGFYTLDDQESFGTSGKLYENNLIMFDRGQDHEWVQMLGRRARKCDTLRRFPLMHTKWGTWKTLHPNTELLTTRTGYDRDYSVDPYPQYSSNNEIYFITSYRKDAKPYSLHGPKTTCFLLDSGSTRFIFQVDVISQAGSYSFKIHNTTSNGQYYSAEDVLATFMIPVQTNDEIHDYAVVVAYNEKKEVGAAWIVATNVSMNGTNWEANFALINGTTVLNYLSAVPSEPALSWGFNDYYKSGVFEVYSNVSSNFVKFSIDLANATENTTIPEKVPVRYTLYRLPMFRSYWFSATAIFPRANILVQDGAQFRFEAYDPEIIYQHPWRPWMIASLVVLCVLACVLVSCTGFSLYHAYHRKRFARLNATEEFVGGAMRDEMKLLIEAGLINPGQLMRNQRQ